MTKQTSRLTLSRLALASVCFLWLAGCTGGGVALGPDAVKGKVPDGAIEMHEVQAAYMASGSGGAGVLSYRGVEYPFDGRWGRRWRHRPLHHRGDGRSVQPARPRAVPRYLWPGALRLCDWHRERWRSLAAERGGRDPAPEGEADGADAQPRGRRRRHLNAPVSGADARIGKELYLLPGSGLNVSRTGSGSRSLVCYRQAK